MFASARTFTRAVNITAAPRSSVTTTTTTRAAAGDVWMPGSARPKYRDGSAPGCVFVPSTSTSIFSFVCFSRVVIRRGLGDSSLFAQLDQSKSSLRSIHLFISFGVRRRAFGSSGVSVRASPVRVSAYPSDRRIRPTKRQRRDATRPRKARKSTRDVDSKKIRAR